MVVRAFEAQLRQAAEAMGIGLRQVELRDGKATRKSWLEIDHPSGRFQYRRGQLCLAQVLWPERPGRSINQLAVAICSSRGALQAQLAEAGVAHWQGWLANSDSRDTVINAIPREAGRLRLRADDAGGARPEPGQIWQVDATQGTTLRSAAEALDRDGAVISVEVRPQGRALVVLASRDAVLAAQLREPLTVVGDGDHSILSLISLANKQRDEDCRILVDDVLCKVLDRQGLSLSDRPAVGQPVQLARSHDSSRGFCSEGLGTQLEPGLAELACSAVRAVPGLHLAAVEILIPEAAPLAMGQGVHVCDIDCAPDLDAFCAPDNGDAATLGAAVLSLLETPEIAALDPWAGHAPSDLDAADPELRGFDAEARAMARDLQRSGLAYRVQRIPGDETTEARAILAFDIAGHSYMASLGARRILTGDGGMMHVNTHATGITGSKSRTKACLEAAGIGTPGGRNFRAAEVNEAVEYACRVGPGRGRAVCIKPAGGHAGILVHPALRTETEIRSACRAIADRFGEIIVEDSLSGEDVRFFYVKPHVIGLLRAVRPWVTGNGRDSLLSLLKTFNAAIMPTGRQRDIRPSGGLVSHLLEQGLTLQSVPEPGRRVTLSPVSNAAAPLEGGQRLEDVHPSYIEAARRAFEAIPGLRVGAMDAMLSDRAMPASPDRFKVLEINSSPGVLTHFLPTFPDDAQPFGPAFLDLLRREGDQIAEEAAVRLAARAGEDADQQVFEQINEALAQIEVAPPEVIAENQFDALLSLLDHASEANPFYAKHLAEVLPHGGEFSPEAWSRLPVLGRDEVRLLGRMLHSDSTPEGGPISTVTTSGSSGSPLSIRWNRVATISTRAAVQRMYAWHGLDLSATYAGLRSYKQPGAQFPGMRMARSWNDAEPDAPFYALSVDTPIERQLDWLEMVRPRYLNTYPSLAAELSELALARGSDLRIEAILTAGEVLTPRIRDLCARGLGARVIDSYGCQELGKIALHCEHPEGGLHICTSNVLVEVLDEAGRPVPQGGTGRVVLTSLYNYAMPFIRYDIGDYVTLSDRPCPCGRTQPVISQVHGRRRNLISLPGGDRRWLPGSVLSELSRIAGARHARLVQTRLDHFELRYVPASAQGQADDARLSACAAERIHPQVRITAVPVAELERGASGKFEDVVGLESHI